jgi:two-component system response regulator (stage 0 sporulation protein F)
MKCETNNPSTRANAGQARPMEAKTPRILVAEDDDEMRALLGQALRSSGYEVAELSDGLHLVARLASAEASEFDAIVSDIRMPGVSGLDVLEGLRKCKDAPPMILITAFGDRETHELARRLGATAMFDKPFDVEELLAELRRVAPPPLI